MAALGKHENTGVFPQSVFPRRRFLVKVQMTETLEIKGFDELQAALQALPEIAKPILKEAMTKSVSVLHDGLAEPAPSSEANRPGRTDRYGKPVGYYERGRGWWYPVKKISGPFGVRKGRLTGDSAFKRYKMKNVNKVVGYKLSQTSKNLEQSWKTQVTVFDNAVVGEVGTIVPYADYVQGTQQAQIHKQRGWQTVSDVLDAKESEIIAFFEDAADQVVEQFNQGK